MTRHGIDTAAAATTLRALANPGRLEILLRLLQAEASVADLEREVGIRQPNLSQQLGELRDAGLVAGRRESRSVIYALADPAAERLVSAISQGFGGDPARLAAAAPVTARTGGKPHLAAVFAVVSAM